MEAAGFEAGAGPAGGDERHLAVLANQRELLIVIALPHTILVHAVEHDFADAAILCLFEPVDRREIGCDGLVGVTGVLINVIVTVLCTAVHAEHHALRTEASGQVIDQVGRFQRR